MKFAKKLKNAMAELGISQKQLITMTGIGASSISQYLNGENEPRVDRQREIAAALGLDPGYFETEYGVMKKAEKAGYAIPALKVSSAAKLMRKAPDTIREGLKQGVFPWGYAVKISGDEEKERWSFFINAKRFADVEKIEIPEGMVE